MAVASGLSAAAAVSIGSTVLSLGGAVVGGSLAGGSLVVSGAWSPGGAVSIGSSNIREVVGLTERTNTILIVGSNMYRNFATQALFQQALWYK